MEYEDMYLEDDFDTSNNDNNASNNVEVEKKTSLDKKLEFNDKEAIKNYDRSEILIYSPEEEQKIVEKTSSPNPEFDKAISDLETKLGRKLSEDEFDKACRSYATILCEDDAKRKDLMGMPVDPESHRLYYEMAKNGQPIVRAARKKTQLAEEAAADEIGRLLEDASAKAKREIEVKSGKPVNVRHKGMVKICEASDGKIYRFDNEKEIELVNMKAREKWLQDKFPEEVSKADAAIVDAVTGKVTVRETDGFE